MLDENVIIWCPIWYRQSVAENVYAGESGAALVNIQTHIRGVEVIFSDISHLLLAALTILKRKAVSVIQHFYVNLDLA